MGCLHGGASLGRIEQEEGGDVNGGGAVSGQGKGPQGGLRGMQKIERP